MRFLDQADVHGVARTLEIPEGVFSAIMLCWEGVNETAKTGAIGDLGVVRVDSHGSPIDNVSVTTLEKITNHLYGLPHNASVEADAFKFCVMIPFSFPTDGAPAGWNAKYFKPDEGTIYIPALSTTTFASAVVTAYGLVSMNPQHYLMTIFEESLTLSGLDPVNYTGNIEAFLINAAATTDPTRIEVLRDGSLKFGMAWGHAVCSADMLGKVEAASNEIAYVDLNQARDPAGIYSANTRLLFVGGTGAIVWCRFGAIIDRSQTDLSVAKRKNKVARIQRDVVAQGRPYPIISILPSISGT